MCYNYSAYSKADERRRKDIIAKGGLDDLDFHPHFYHTNGFNKNKLPIITQESPDVVQYFRWGDWLPGDDFNCLNARAETIFTSPAFRNEIRNNRCLIEADAFFDWRTLNGKKFPYCIKVTDEKGNDRPFFFGGIYRTRIDKETGEVHQGFSMITVPANEIMAVIHNLKQRMPLILTDEQAVRWLQSELTTNQIAAMLQPYPSKNMRAYTISKLITSRKESSNVPEVLAPFQYPGVEAQL
ncbi:MAG: SOS response-associated peptidase [Chitinophagales bacterium]